MRNGYRVPRYARAAGHAVTLVLIAANSILPAAGEERPTRSECIVGYTLDWSSVGSDPYTVREEMFDWLPSHRDTANLAAMVVKPDGSQIFLQYLARCGERRQMASDLIGYWRSKGLDLPRFQRLPEPILPSPDTIDRRGPYWRDPVNPPVGAHTGPTDT